MTKILNIMLAKNLGGIEQAFLDCTEALALEGHQVKCVIRKGAEIKPHLEKLIAKRNTKIEFEEISNFSKFDLFSKLKSEKIVKEFSPDITICHGNRAMELYRKSSQKNGSKVVGVAHNYSLKYIVKCDYIFSITEDLKKTISAEKFPEEKIFIVPNMIRIPGDFNFVTEEQKANYNNPVKIGVMARFVKKKGVDIFLKSLSALKASNIYFEAVIGGTGEEFEELQKLRDELLLQNEVRFSGWIGDKNEFYENVDIFCLPSLHEPFGIVVLEAMLAGKPIVSTDSEGPLEILEHEKDALMVEKGHAGQLAIALQKMITKDANYRLNLVINAQKKLIERYKLESVAKKISIALEKITNDN